jgi:hypothetical protein
MLALKLFLVPSLICAITLAGRRWGPAVAGWLSGFPVVSAPVLFFLATEQGPSFAATAAAATLSAVPAVFLFLLSYAWMATRSQWVASLSVGWAAYFAAIALLNVLGPPWYLSAPVVYLAIAIAPRLLPSTSAPLRSPMSSYRELMLRMAAGATLVLALTYFASDLGARLSGLFAMFPVLGTVLAVFSHRQAGAPFTVSLLRGMTLGYYAFTSFCLILAIALPQLPIGPAFAMALLASGLIQALVRRHVRRG